MSTSRDIFKIADDFASLLRVRDIILSENGDTAPIDGEIANYFNHDITSAKIDTVIGALRHAEVMESAAKAEAERCSKMAKSYATQREWLKGTIQRVMEMAGTQRLEGKTAGHLLLKGNGGKPAVEITNESLIPATFKTLTLKVNAAQWNNFQIECQECSRSMAVALSRLMSSEGFQGVIEVNKGRIAAALEKPCTNCEECGYVEPPADENIGPLTCGICDGNGTSSVPGARFAERGSSVIVK